MWAGRALTCTKHKQYDEVEDKEMKVQMEKNKDAWRRLKRLEKRGGSLPANEMPLGLRPSWMDDDESDDEE